MHLSQIKLENFRSYKKIGFDFSPKINLIIGKNGSGKSNLLEAIFFLSSGKSFKAQRLGQLINWQDNFAIVSGFIDDYEQENEIEAQIVKTETGGVNRKYFIRKIAKPRNKYLGIFKCVLFEPEDIRLLSGSPSRRRDFLDTIFSNSEWKYQSALSQYNRALKHRNELLDLIALNRAKKTDLYYWNQSMIKNAEIIHSFRLDFVRSVNSFWQNHDDNEINKLTIKYLASTLNQNKMEQNLDEEIQLGYTRKGPHRDDFTIQSEIFENEDKNMAFWGSRGQQRLAVLALRLGQINYFQEKYKERPILLLDDIFSELDEKHRKIVVEICHKYQTIFTSAEIEAQNYLPTAQIINL